MEQAVYEMQKLEDAETVYDCEGCGASFKYDPELVYCGTCGVAICIQCTQSWCEGCSEPLCEHHTRTVGDLDYCPDCEAEGRQEALALGIEEYTEVIHAHA